MKSTNLGQELILALSLSKQALNEKNKYTWQS